MGGETQKESIEGLRSMTVRRSLYLLSILFFFLLSISCASQPKRSILVRDLAEPPAVIQEVFAREGKSDYSLLFDEGYSLRLIYLCENRVLNFVEEPRKNPVLVSIQTILDTPVEKKLSADDRRRIWACIERKVWERHSRVEEYKRRLFRERMQLERELSSVQAEKKRVLAEIAEKKRLEAEKKRRIERERRRAEEERQRKIAEEQRKFAEEERKIRYYKTGEKDGPSLHPPPSPMPKATESGVFMVMKEARILEEPRENSKTIARASKYDLFDVINAKNDGFGNRWYHVFIGERMISERGRKIGWSPEEKSFWVRNKLLAWVYPGDPANIQNVRPLKIKPEDVHFTGKVTVTPQKLTFHEVNYGMNTTIREEIFGWVAEEDGIRRHTKTKDEMRTLLKDLSKTMWPLRIQEDILKGYIRQGFTREQVVLSWGRPDHVNTKSTLVGVHEQWVYGEPPFPKSYVYFENGVVKDWEFIRNRGK
jgi:DNA-binding protein H-NS